MNSIAAHVEYLLRKHDCVVLPGLGALLCNYVPAHFDESNPLSINPRGRALAFNSMLVDSDGMLAWSVARREGISFEAASKKVADEITMLRRQLLAEGEIVFGRLGVFVTEGTGEVMFYPASLPSVNGAFYGLQPIEAVPLDMTDSSHGQAAYARQVGEAVVAESVATRRAGWRAYATGIVASLAIVLTAVMFMMPSVSVNRPVETASIAPVPSAEIDRSAHFNGYNMALLTVDLPLVKAPAVEVKPVEEPAVEPTPQTLAAAPTAVAANETVAPKKLPQVSVKPSEVVKRFNDSDTYCVIVASFPTRAQAEEYVARAGSRKLGILEKDNKFRVYAATASSYAGANEQKNLVGQQDAWVCRR